MLTGFCRLWRRRAPEGAFNAACVKTKILRGDHKWMHQRTESVHAPPTAGTGGWAYLPGQPARPGTACSSGRFGPQILRFKAFFWNGLHPVRGNRRSAGDRFPGGDIADPVAVHLEIPEPRILELPDRSGRKTFLRNLPSAAKISPARTGGFREFSAAAQEPAISPARTGILPFASGPGPGQPAIVFDNQAVRNLQRHDSRNPANRVF
jgi:hypothetical protein